MIQAQVIVITRNDARIQLLQPCLTATSDTEPWDGKSVAQGCYQTILSDRGILQPNFAVPKKDGGWRPLINLQRLNRYISTTHFKMESIASWKDVIHKGDFTGKLDLKDAYLSVPMNIKRFSSLFSPTSFSHFCLAWPLQCQEPWQSYSVQWKQKGDRKVYISQWYFCSGQFQGPADRQSWPRNWASRSIRRSVSGHLLKPLSSWGSRSIH